MSTRTRPKAPAQCVACGSSASIIRASAKYGMTQNVCYAHEYACWPHLLDPCPQCDVL